MLPHRYIKKLRMRISILFSRNKKSNSSSFTSLRHAMFPLLVCSITLAVSEASTTSYCLDQTDPFRLPNGNAITCNQVLPKRNSLCDTKEVQENCPALCKVCPNCDDTVGKVWMGRHGSQTCDFVRENDVCDTHFWVKDMCPLSCGSCCVDRNDEIPFNENLGGPMTCESFKLDEFKVYCALERIQISCPDSCKTCAVPPPNVDCAGDFADMNEQIYLEGKYLYCHEIPFEFGPDGDRNYCKNWNRVIESCPVTCQYCSNLSSAPTNMPTMSTANPSSTPTNMPTISTANPSSAPTNVPTISTVNPSSAPTDIPTISTANPSSAPTDIPTISTVNPSSAPTDIPTISTKNPSSAPTSTPTDVTTVSTANPNSAPSKIPTMSSMNPTSTKTKNPTISTANPTSAPTDIPTISTTNPTTTQNINRCLASINRNNTSVSSHTSQALSWIKGLNPLPIDCNGPNSIIQKYVLALFYYQMSGDNWVNNTGWLVNGIMECQWSGISCEGGAISRISLGKSISTS